jgi:hypothetical protein
MGEKVLVVFNGDWADEMDVVGFDVWELEKWDAYVKSVYAYEWDWARHSLSVGSNQEIYWKDADDYINDFKVFLITDEDITKLRTWFGGWGNTAYWGRVPTFED